MRKIIFTLSFLMFLFSSQPLSAQANSKENFVQEDLQWSTDSPAGFQELQIPSAGSLLQGFMYKANGSKPHPLFRSFVAAARTYKYSNRGASAVKDATVGEIAR